ncbi:MAG: LptF/LptG family permease [Planctomycetes bacterium]|nr:LptF/LptG family permease [Planctomycetota bacterium]
MIRKLDRYVLRIFLTSTASALLVCAGLVVLLHQLQHFDNLMATRKALKAAGELDLVGKLFPLTVKFYLCEVAIRFFQYAPFVVLFGTVFTAARLHRTHESVAMLASGVSLPRGFLPVFVAAGLIAATHFTFRETLLPTVARESAELDTLLFEGKRERVVEKLSFVDDAGRRIRFARYWPEKARGERCEIYAHGADQVVRSLSASVATYLIEDGRGHWTFIDAKTSAISRTGAPVADGNSPQWWDRELQFTPADCETAARWQLDPTYLSFRELETLARRNPSSSHIQVLLHTSLVAALANLLLPLLGLPCVLRIEKRSTIEGVVFAIGLAVLYYAFSLFCIQLGIEETVGPVAAAWLPVILFGSLGIVLFESMKT